MVPTDIGPAQSKGWSQRLCGVRGNQCSGSILETVTSTRSTKAVYGLSARKKSL
jgi:hypothetical protein